jgi:hypothetical protein
VLLYWRWQKYILRMDDFWCANSNLQQIIEMKASDGVKQDKRKYLQDSNNQLKVDL